jgi:NADPH-dependent 2,4-dienoyl-CoA reductase/sulfur reductase-like enzyme/rhodanese-related sulfurtransferase
MAVNNLHHAEWIKAKVQKGEVGAAVVIGAGAVGLEVAEALTDLWGVETTVLERSGHVLPSLFSPEMAHLVADAYGQGEVAIRTNDGAAEILGNAETGVTGVRTASGEEIACELVVMAAGARPNTTLGAAAGLAVGPLDGYLVDETMRTSDPSIYAGGDCVEVRHLVSGRTAYLPLGSMANRQGRVIGTNITGGRASFRGAVGSFCIKAFEAAAARAGLTEAQAEAEGFEPVSSVVAMHDRAHFYPTKKMMYLKLVCDRQTRAILGVEAVGENGDAVKARVDAIGAAMLWGATVEDVSNLEVAYSPPFAQAMDIVNAAANTLENILEGRNETLGMREFMEGFEQGRFKVLDVRGAANAAPYQDKYGERWLNIPGDELHLRLEELDSEEPMVLFCNSGQRSFEAQTLLRQSGKDVPPNVQGGHLLLNMTDREFLTFEGDGETDE